MKSQVLLWMLLTLLTLNCCLEKPNNITFTQVFDGTIQVAKEKNKQDSIAHISLTDPLNIAVGKELFEVNCVACHQKNGLGNLGPNLSDKKWINGGKASDINEVITNGVPNKGMKAWNDVFTPLQIQQLVAYVLSLGENS